MLVEIRCKYAQFIRHRDYRWGNSGIFQKCTGQNKDMNSNYREEGKNTNECQNEKVVTHICYSV